MLFFLLGLIVALGGALLLAAGSELQSCAVYLSGGRWKTFLRSPKWLIGLALLGIAISTNFIALALAPVSAIQSMSVVALAASATYGVAKGRIVFTSNVGAAILACLAGIFGFVWTIATHPGGNTHSSLDNQLIVVISIQASVTILGIITAVVIHEESKRATNLVGLIVGAAGFGTITVVFKVLVGLVIRNGFFEVISRPTVIIALLSLLVGGVTSAIHLQLAHKVLPTPTVVAGLTTVDTITAALIGTLVLKESQLSLGPSLLLVFFGLIAIGGVLGLRNLHRRDELNNPPTNQTLTILKHEMRDI